MTCNGGGEGSSGAVDIDGRDIDGSVDMFASGSGRCAVSGVGVDCESFKIAVASQHVAGILARIDKQATERLGAGSVYFVRFGSGEAGRLGVSWMGRGVDSLAIVTVHH